MFQLLTVYPSFFAMDHSWRKDPLSNSGIGEKCAIQDF